MAKAPKIITDLKDPKLSQQQLAAAAQAIDEKGAEKEAEKAARAAMAEHATLWAKKIDVELRLSGFQPGAQTGILLSVLADRIAVHKMNHKAVESALFQAVTTSRRYQERHEKLRENLAVVDETTADINPEVLRIVEDAGEEVAPAEAAAPAESEPNPRPAE